MKLIITECSVIFFRSWHEQTQSSDLRLSEPALASSWPASILRGPHPDAETGRAASLVRSGWGQLVSAQRTAFWQVTIALLSLSSSLPLSLVCFKSWCPQWPMGYESLQLEGVYCSIVWICVCKWLQSTFNSRLMGPTTTFYAPEPSPSSSITSAGGHMKTSHSRTTFTGKTTSCASEG